MTPETFLNEFGALAETPGGVAKLRELVLELAVRGRLVRQDPRDEPASSVGDNNENVIEPWPWVVPEGWTWTLLGSLNDPAFPISYGVLVPGPDTDGGVPFVRVQDLTTTPSPPLPSKRISVDVEVKYARTRLIGGEVLLGVVGSIGKVGRVPPSWTGANIARAVCRLKFHASVNVEYCAYVLQSTFVQEYFKTSTRTLAQPTLNVGLIKKTPFPIPPLPEQKRIVAKVDQLMTLCNELEARQTKRRKLSVRATAASLAALTDAQEPKTLRASWKRVSGQFDALLDNVENVGQLRQAIFGLACAGHLTEQRASAEPILAAVQRRKQAWIADSDGNGEAARLRKKLESHEPLLPELPPPAGWVWASLLTACWRVVDCHNKTAPYTANGIPLVRTSNVRSGSIDLDNTKFVSKETYEYWSRRCPPEAGDVLFTREAPMGECGIVPPGVRLCMGQRMMLLRTFPDLIMPEYLVCALRDPLFQQRMVKSGVGSTVKHLRVGDVEGLAVAIPPTEEQERIVAKVDRLMALCDDLEAKIKLSDERGEKLMKAVIEAMVVSNREIDGVTCTHSQTDVARKGARPM